jgi:hypothetical protein
MFLKVTLVLEPGLTLNVGASILNLSVFIFLKYCHSIFFNFSSPTPSILDTNEIGIIG